VEGPREVDESGLQPDRRTKMNEKLEFGHTYASSRSAAVPLKRGESLKGVEVLRNKIPNFLMVRLDAFILEELKFT
jgi:hypothetical protein